MSVQAQTQYTSPALMVPNTNVFEHVKHHHDLFSSFAYQGALQPLCNGTVFSEPESDLTCNNIMYESRKRNRVGDTDELKFQKFPKTQTRLLNLPQATSTCGRSCSGNSPFDFNSYLLQQNLETDALIHLQNEKLRSGLEETHKRQCRSMLSVIEHQVLKRLEEKENELTIASQRNRELEERVKQMTAENQIWFNVAKNNEAIVTTLKSSLEQILVQSQGQLREGFGDSDSVVDDAQSCSSAPIAVEETEKKNCCKVCHENGVSVLVLPCRHLCLCKNCDSITDMCPICNSVKNASFRFSFLDISIFFF